MIYDNQYRNVFLGNFIIIVDISSLLSNVLAQVINYFNKFPLYTSKYLDYKDWEEVAHFIINNKHLTVEGIKTVELARSRMNTKRTEFN